MGAAGGDAGTRRELHEDLLCAGSRRPAGAARSTHDGYEYGFVLSGVIEITVGDEVFVLREGESLGFDSTIPHVLRNPGPNAFEGIWFVHGRKH